MKKLFWLTLGVSIGVMASRQLQRIRTQGVRSTADSVLDRTANVVESTIAAFKQGSAEREAELRAALGVDKAPSGRRAAR
ncbi:hypothetical protein [Pseudoglutamicibacter cumminsii]|uniref:hypothetical protein n=1 Tax=Pseudoglutamicibacter cumminsii TaxID=156979 RepID=UPI0019572AEB|nr:hypothetical protein [Pseudoglutamicibacter cumminsii]MBM7796822.1 hypothetical protein [Pseudoglutamicibacter cumminsii]MCT1685522.1 hypothetical protein [Pseudoglutamicibacter cumminsii]